MSGDIGIQWHITDNCNLRCAHCYQSSFSSASEVPLDRLVEVAHRIFGASLETRFILNVTGGEPFVDKRLSALIRHLAGHDNLIELNVISNGTVVAGEPLEALRESGKAGALKISLESADPGVNDGVRGSGNLARVLRNLPVLKEKSGRDVILMATLARYNAAHVPELVALAREVGARGVIFERFVPLGTGEALLEEVLTADLWERAVEEIVKAAGLDVPAGELSRFTAFEVMTDGREDALRGAQCELGGDSMALMPDGDVHPCRRLPVKVGNVLEEPFVEILERLKEYRPLEGGDPRCLGCRAIERAIGSG